MQCAYTAGLRSRRKSHASTLKHFLPAVGLVIARKRDNQNVGLASSGNTLRKNAEFKETRTAKLYSARLNEVAFVNGNADCRMKKKELLLYLSIFSSSNKYRK